jgi:hypothetical protein
MDKTIKLNKSNNANTGQGTQVEQANQIDQNPRIDKAIKSNKSNNAHKIDQNASTIRRPSQISQILPTGLIVMQEQTSQTSHTSQYLHGR